jgi:PmbA protein
MSGDLELLARDAVAWMKARSSETQAEIFLSSGEARSVSRREGERDGVEASESSGAGVRVVRDGRVGFAAAGGAGLEAIKDLYARAVEQLPHAEPDPRRVLPGPEAEPANDASSAWTLHHVVVGNWLAEMDQDWTLAALPNRTTRR